MLRPKTALNHEVQCMGKGGTQGEFEWNVYRPSWGLRDRVRQWQSYALGRKEQCQGDPWQNPCRSG
jgi:hypothetical protein